MEYGVAVWLLWIVVFLLIGVTVFAWRPPRWYERRHYAEQHPRAYGEWNPYAWLNTRGKHRGRGPRGYKRPDLRIAEDVNDRLTHDDLIDASDIQVIVNDGEVHLHGTVDTRLQKRLAEDVVDSVPGVVDVHNSLVLRTHGEPPRVPDQDAAAPM